jgi:hypothetical protein
MKKEGYIYLIMCAAIITAIGCRQTYDPIKAIRGGLSGDSVAGYFMSSDYCVDCTLRLGIKSGTNIQPPFWQ